MMIEAVIRPSSSSDPPPPPPPAPSRRHCPNLLYLPFLPFAALTTARALERAVGAPGEEEEEGSSGEAEKGGRRKPAVVATDRRKKKKAKSSRNESSVFLGKRPEGEEGGEAAAEA